MATLPAITPAIAAEVKTFTVRHVYPGNSWDLAGTPVGDAFIEKTGVNFHMDYSVGDEAQSIALMIAGGDLADIVVPHYAVAPFVEAGVALELTDLIEQYAPNYKADLGTAWDRMIWNAADHGRYYLSAPEQYPESLDYFNWFFLQHAVVRDQGYPQIETLEDYENAIRTYIEQNPTIDGQPTIGMTMVTDSWRWILSLTNPSMMVAGTQSSGEYYVDPDTMEVTYRILTGEEKEYFRWLNHMYNEGLLDKEAFTQTYDQYQAKIATGRVLALSDMGWSFGAATQALRQDGKDERTYGCYPLVIHEGIVNSSMSGERTLSSAGMEALITTACKDPVTLMQALNYYYSEEGQILSNWGIEGTHYDVVDGQRVFRQAELDKRVQDSEYSRKTGIALLNFLPGYRDGVRDSSGQFYTTASKENSIAQYSPIEKEVLAAYGKETWADFFAPPSEFPLRMWPGEGGHTTDMESDSEGAIAFQRVQDAVKKGVINAIIVKPESFDSAWDAMVADMKSSGVDAFTDAIEKLNHDKLLLWGLIAE
ncbi:ABC transporter substrate-binding protein [Clostridia bacterium]|nr:ABC transporter substrate-binding protein [Clostridia bacterium]